MKLRTTIALIVIAIITTIIVMNTVSGASIGEFQLNQDVEIYQTCNNCTSCNFTRVMQLNNNTLLSNLTAKKDGTYFFYNISKGNFTSTGEYKYCYECGNSVEQETGCIDFEITYSGTDITGPVASIYILAMVFLVFIFILIVLFINKLPSGDVADEQGMILQINSLKHLRLMMWIIAWFVILAMMFLLSNITLAYLPTKMLGNFFFNMYNISFRITLVGVPIMFAWTIWKLFKDKEMKQMLERGVQLGKAP